MLTAHLIVRLENVVLKLSGAFCWEEKKLKKRSVYLQENLGSRLPHLCDSAENVLVSGLFPACHESWAFFILITHKSTRLENPITWLEGERTGIFMMGLN